MKAKDLHTDKSKSLLR